MMAPAEYRGPRCPGCGAILPDTRLVALCERCLNARYREQMVARETEWLARTPNPRMLTARGQGQRLHLLLLADSRWAYCGERVHARVYTRKQAYIPALPIGCCRDCLAALRKIAPANLTGELHDDTDAQSKITL